MKMNLKKGIQVKIISGKDRSLIFDEKGKQIQAKSKGYIHQF